VKLIEPSVFENEFKPFDFTLSIENEEDWQKIFFMFADPIMIDVFGFSHEFSDKVLSYIKKTNPQVNYSDVGGYGNYKMKLEHRILHKGGKEYEHKPM